MARDSEKASVLNAFRLQVIFSRPDYTSTRILLSDITPNILKTWGNKSVIFLSVMSNRLEKTTCKCFICISRLCAVATLLCVHFLVSYANQDFKITSVRLSVRSFYPVLVSSFIRTSFPITKRHAMKAYRGCGDKSPHVLTPAPVI